MFGYGAGPTEHAGGAASVSEDRQQQTPVPSSGGHKPTPRSVRTLGSLKCRIVSIQDSDAAPSTTDAGAAGRAGGRRVQCTDQTTTTRVSSSAGTPRPSSCFFRARVWSRAAIGALSPTLLSSSQAPDVRLRAATVSRHRQSFDLQACTSNTSATRPGKRASFSTCFQPSARSHTRTPSDAPRL